MSTEISTSIGVGESLMSKIYNPGDSVILVFCDSKGSPYYITKSKIKRVNKTCFSCEYIDTSKRKQDVSVKFTAYRTSIKHTKKISSWSKHTQYITFFNNTGDELLIKYFQAYNSIRSNKYKEKIKKHEEEIKDLGYSIKELQKKLEVLNGDNDIEKFLEGFEKI